MILARLPNTMTPSSFQLPPVKPKPSPRDSTTPSATSTRFSVRPSLKPTNRPSGDQNSGEPMASVGATSRVSPDAKEWTRRRGSRDSSPSIKGEIAAVGRQLQDRTRILRGGNREPHGVGDRRLGRRQAPDAETGDDRRQHRGAGQLRRAALPPGSGCGPRVRGRAVGILERAQQTEPDIGDVPQAVPGVLRQAAAQHARHRPRHVGRQRCPRGLGLDDLGEDAGHVVALERPAPREHLVHDDAERPHVGAPVDGPAPRLLG